MTKLASEVLQKNFQLTPAGVVENLPKMTGKVVAVTGCTSGTGKIFAQVGVVKRQAAKMGGYHLKKLILG